MPIDVLFDQIGGNLKFASIKARARLAPVAHEVLIVASLADVIKSKTAAGRPKDKAVLPILEATMRTRQAAGLEKLRKDVRDTVTEFVVDHPRSKGANGTRRKRS